MWLFAYKGNQFVSACSTCGKLIPHETGCLKTQYRFCPYCGEAIEGIALFDREEYESVL